MTKPQIAVSASVLPLLCLLVYLDAFGIVLPFLLAAVLHEASHLAVMRLSRVPVSEIVIRPSGVTIRAVFPKSGLEAFSTAAGPLANLLLALIFRAPYPRFCLANAALLAYNLLPIYPLDGGRLLRLLLVRVFGPTRGERFSQFVSAAAILAVVIIFIESTFRGSLDLLPLLFALFFLCKLPNISCQIPHSLLK